MSIVTVNDEDWLSISEEITRQTNQKTMLHLGIWSERSSTGVQQRRFKINIGNYITRPRVERGASVRGRVVGSDRRW
jgi:hypothetical protein